MASHHHGDLKLHYLARGAGPPLVFVHGLGSSAADWGFQIPTFESRFRVIAPDLPGCGHSRPLSSGYEIADFARTLWTLLDDLGLRDPNVVGFSLGGAVALEMALQRPGAVPRLALINSLASYRIDDFRKWFEARVPVALVRTIGMRNMARLLSGRSFPEAWQRPMRERAISVIGKVPAETFLGMCAGLERWRALDRLHSLRSRTLLIAGEHDFTSLDEKEALAARIGAQFVAVRGSRHGTPYDAVAITNACLLALLTDQPLPPRELWTRDESAEASAAALAIRIAEEHAAARALAGLR